MAEPLGSNGNASVAREHGILNDVWDAAGHQLRVGPAGGGLVVSKTMTFAGATPNDPGNFGGTGTPWNLFSVSGTVLVAVIGVCSTTLTGASGTLSVGVTGSVTRFIPTTTGTTITSGRTVDITGLVAAGTAPVVTPNQAALTAVNITGTTGTANITAGVVTFYAFYRPLSAGATVTAL